MSDSAIDQDVAVRLESITKAFGELKALDDVSLALRLGEIHALVGENGAGKTTLMKVLFGTYQPTSGRILLDGRDVTAHWNTRKAIAHHVGMVHQHFSLVMEHSVLDNIVMPTLGWADLAPDWAKFRNKLQELQESLGFKLHPDRPVGELAVGERQQVEILKMLYQGAKILILDEPTAVLIPQQTERLLQTLVQLRELGYAVILITHKLEHATEFADTITVLRGGKRVATVSKGEASTSEIASMMVKQEIAAVHQPRVNDCDTPVIELADVSMHSAGVPVLDRVNLRVCEGEIVGIAGVVGNGQSELVEVILGLRRPDAGTIRLQGTDIGALETSQRRARGIANIPEDRHTHAIVGDMDLAANLILGREGSTKFSRYGILNRKEIDDFARHCMGEFDVRAQSVGIRIKFLSGGNQQKVVIGRELSTNPKLIIAHEPSRGLDFAATAYVRSRLVHAAEDGAGVLLISSDLDELMELSTRILVLYNGRLVGSLSPGKYCPETLGMLMAGISPDSGAPVAAAMAI
ncbi:ABC transporter ATP-binding protein [Castellaniella sp. GW247-6E4]|uniref:ABC transporter ATP-binding protein n=1 Tax=Castellaniella sp. GW247-6E4 TaxID=3140380 RepID=UPI00331456EE